MIRTVTVVVGVVVALATGAPAAAWGSCAAPPEERRAQAPVAVEGVMGEGGLIAVERYLAGHGPMTLRLAGADDAAVTSVDLDWAPGERWVLYGRLDGDVLSSGLCDGSHRAGEDPDPDLAAMSGVAADGGAGDAHGPASGDPGAGVAPLLLGVGLLIAAGGGVLAVRARTA